MKKNKGFTLVEIIVILVILAIMAAILIPSLTTYIDKAKEKQVTANARSAYVATQAMASEMYALDYTIEPLEAKGYTDENVKTIVGCCTANTSDGDAELEESYVLWLAQLTDTEIAATVSATITDGTINEDTTNGGAAFVYTQKLNNNTYVCTHSATGAWSCVKSN